MRCCNGYCGWIIVEKSKAECSENNGDEWRDGEWSSGREFRLDSVRKVEHQPEFLYFFSSVVEMDNCNFSSSHEVESCDRGLSRGVHGEDEKIFGCLDPKSLVEDQTEGFPVTLRQCLAKPRRIVDRSQNLYIFAQVLEAVNTAHSQGRILRNIRPSCIRLSSSYRISLVANENLSSSDSNSRRPWHNICNVEGRPSYDFQEDSTSVSCGNRGPELVRISSCNDGNVVMPDMASSSREISVKRKGKMGVDMRITSMEVVEDGKKQEFVPHHMEVAWYTCPEELVGESCSVFSNIYSLGVLFFELFYTFSSEEEHCRIMANVRHRLLPPQFLLEWPKEHAFCLWLLHPEPSQRPQLSEVLQNDIVTEARIVLVESNMAKKLDKEIADTDLLLEFLIQVQHRKQATAEKFHTDVTCLMSDIEIVLKQQSILKHRGISSFDFSKEERFMLQKGKKASCLPPQLEQRNGRNSTSRSSRFNAFAEKTGKTITVGKRSQKGYENDSMNFGKKLVKSNVQNETKVDIMYRSGRMLKNIKEIEKLYFSTKYMESPFLSDSFRRYSGSCLGQGPMISSGGPDVNLLNSIAGIFHPSGESSVNRLGSFFDSLSKYLRFSKFEVKATIRQGSLVNSPGLVCSLSFDRDKEYFATAGLNKKIKVFEYDTVMNEVLDIHYPVTEMTSRSRLSSICWNSYIKNQIASSSFDGMVQLWDITRNQAVMDFNGHERRVWSVDFSQTDPRQLASGGDDGHVKLWNISQEESIGTIKTNANVCCVQFPPDSPYMLALGSADYKIYCYDLRNIKRPWCFLESHKRTVSYIKFLGSSNIVSASTDGTVKLWDLAASTGGLLSNPVRTFTGHRNEKNFVGLSVADGYIATGSESNEVFVYHRSVPIPVACYKFNSIDAMNGCKLDDDAGQFVSSVCWRGQSQILVAANSGGDIRILEMV